MAGFELPTIAIRKQIASALHILVQLERMREGARKVVQICELTGMEEDTISMQDIFVFDGEGTGAKPRLVPTGLRPRILDRLVQMNVEPAPELAALFPAIRPAGKVRWEERF
jgi:pilus assembly protein CpaF